MNKLYILLLALLVSPALSMAQTAVEKADWKYEDKNYLDAAADYEKLITKINAADARAQMAFRLGNCYFYMNDYANAQKWFQQAADANATNGELFVNFGDIYTYRGQYEQAIQLYRKAESDTAWTRIARQRIQSAQNAPQKKEVFSVLLHLNEKGLNSEMGDYGIGYIGADKAVFTTSSSLFSTGRDKKTGQGFSRLVMAAAGDNGDWKILSALPANINSEFNNGSFSYDQVHKTAFFSQCNGSDGKGKTCVLMASSYDPAVGTWGTPEVLPFCNDGSNYAHPAISADGRTLFFTSDRTGGYGGKDIYKASRGAAVNSWGAPANLGAEINTAGNEGFPTVSGDSLFFFSSNGKAGLGGYDIFKARYNYGNPSKPQAMDIPFNSPGDDFGLVYSPAGRFDGFYCSNRAGGIGNDDIYRFMLDPKYKTITGFIREETTGLPLANARVTLQGTDGSTLTATTDHTGKFRLDNVNPESGYKILGSADGYFSASTLVKALDLSSASDQSALLNERNSASINLMKITKDEIKLDNIYYEYNKAELTDASKRELSKLVTLLKETPAIHIVINAHSDEQGSDKYNLELSQRRAKSVVDFLVENGIDAARLSSKGWGESSPLHKNASTEEQHAANRRTTFQVTNAQ